MAPPKKSASKTPTAKPSAGKKVTKKTAAQPSAGKKVAKKSAAKPSAAKKPAAKPTAAKKSAAPPIGALAVAAGQRAPEFELPDQDGALVRSSELTGTRYVLYFYPKDDTPGCTVEASDFRELLPAFKRAGVRVLGVSPDSCGSHARFARKHRLSFTLLSDEAKVLAGRYGVWVEKKQYGRAYMGIERSTFLVGADGVVRRVWRSVKVAGHASSVLAAARERG